MQRPHVRLSCRLAIHHGKHLLAFDGGWWYNTLKPPRAPRGPSVKQIAESGKWARDQLVLRLGESFREAASPPIGLDKAWYGPIG